MVRRILLTGASGFIGKALHSYLKTIDNIEVIVVSRKNGIDITKNDWVQLLPNVDVDTIFHLAQSTRYREFPEGVEDMRQVNIDATAQLLEWARTHNANRFIFTSSGNVYKPSIYPLTERDPTEPETYYGASKLCAEHLISQYIKSFKIINARLFGVYGPGQKKMIIPEIIGKLIRNEEITLAQGKGLIFSPLYISDCVRILNILSNCTLPSNNVVINIGGNEICNLGYIVNKLETYLGINCNIQITKENPKIMTSNITKLKSIISTFNFLKIDIGLMNVINYMKNENEPVVTD